MKKNQGQQPQQQQHRGPQVNVVEEEERLEPVQSRSFKILQRLTSGFEEGNNLLIVKLIY